MAYGVYSDRGYREHILERNKNTNKTEVFTQEDQTFTGRKTFLSGVTTSDLEVQTVEVSESLKVKGKDITEIIDYLPNDVSEENKLTTEDFVNSSIATNTAYFRGTFESVEDLEAYEGEKTNNDYAFVRTADEFGAISFNRYKYNSQSESWEYEYTLNNSSFTSAQWDAINSGITEELVAQIGQGGGSALVPSITESEYEKLTEEEKNNGQIREIKDTEPKKVMLNGMDLNGNIINENAPIGTLMQYAKDCPNGYVKCNGTSLSRTNYNRLFEKIGTTYGADDENTFKVPLITDKAELDIEYMTGRRHTDGKPIYYKAMSIPAKVYYSWEYIDATDNMSIDKVIDATMYGTDSFDGLHTDCMCSAAARRYSNNRFAFIAINYTIIANRLGIEYTKTTDTENTFCYNQLAGDNFCIKATEYAENVDPNNIDDSKTTTGNVWTAAKTRAEIDKGNIYSTEEVETAARWVDNRIIYRKVFVDLNNSWIIRDNIIGNIENLKEPISIKAIAFNDTGLSGWVENNEGGDAGCYAYIKSNGEVHFYRNDIRDGTAYPKKVIIEYTKTTD